jgi:hypothetical protein
VSEQFSGHEYHENGESNHQRVYSQKSSGVERQDTYGARFSILRLEEIEEQERRDHEKQFDAYPAMIMNGLHAWDCLCRRQVVDKDHQESEKPQAIERR